MVRKWKSDPESVSGWDRIITKTSSSDWYMPNHNTKFQ